MDMKVIFDMDGVLIDSEIHWKEIQSDFLRGIIPSWSEEDQVQLIGLSAHDVYRRLVDHYQLSMTMQEYFSYYKDITAEIYGRRCNMLPGSFELLEHLKEKNIQVSLASSSPHAWIDIVLARFELSTFFNFVVSADDLGGVGKPDPGIYLKTAELMKVEPSQCLAIEDSSKGVTSAVSAGMTCIAIRNGFNDHQDLSLAHEIITSFEGVSEFSLSRVMQREDR